MVPNQCENGQPIKGSEKNCLDFHYNRIGTRSQDAERLGIPFMLTEFGACMDGEECSTEIRQVLEVCDVNLTGWAYWQFKTYKDLTTSAGE